MPTPHSILKEYFGYDQFRPLQLDIIESVAQQRRDTLVLMPTGGGKSLCYQIPAMLGEGLCVVISPLIALMKDQVEALRQNGVNAAFINSTQALAEQRYIEQECLDGRIKLLYVSPEKLQNEGFKMFLWQLNVALFAIDEAHCISFWGHDFRPEYTQLAQLKARFSDVPMIALTATADELTRQDIQTQLSLRNPNVFISSFDRPNLFLEVRPAQDRVKRIIEFLMLRPNESGIIYCLSRKTTEQLAEKLNNKGFKAAAYHAGLPNTERSAVQEAFIKDDIPIICATIAFGMGIDKPNVRFVIHYNLPKNIESYYQEIGRAGRDGLPARTTLFYSFADVALQREMLEAEESNIKALKLAKLERLQQFAEAHLCRRRILLNYFNEHTDRPCGKCDICLSPRQMIDGTLIAQKALSAVARTAEKEPIGTIIDILRGTRSPKVRENGYDQLKTFGAGQDLKMVEWNDFIVQLINLGYLHIAYHRHNALVFTPRSKAVLQGTEIVQLAQLIPRGKDASTALPTADTIATTYNKDLFDHLRRLRKELADEQGVPPYVIFADTALREMATYLPRNEAQMLNISGIGVRKMAFYGQTFIDGIAEFLARNPEANSETSPTIYAPPPEKKVSTHQILKQQYTDLLKVWRNKAAAYYKTQATALLPNTTLDALADAVPVTPREVTDIWAIAHNEKLVHSLLAQSIAFLTSEGSLLKSKTREVSYAYYTQGNSPDQIAEKRHMAANTIYSHLIELSDREGYEIDLSRYISQRERHNIEEALQKAGQGTTLKDVLELLGGEPYSYGKIKLVLWLNSKK